MVHGSHPDPCSFINSFVHRAVHYALYIGRNVYIRVTLYMCYPLYDVIMRAMCTMVSCHIWSRYV